MFTFMLNSGDDDDGSSYEYIASDIDCSMSLTITRMVLLKVLLAFIKFAIQQNGKRKQENRSRTMGRVMI